MLVDPYAAYGRTGEKPRVNDLPRICADIRDRFPVSGVAEQAGVKLQRAGREMKGCCPFRCVFQPLLIVRCRGKCFF